MKKVTTNIKQKPLRLLKVGEIITNDKIYTKVAAVIGTAVILYLHRSNAEDAKRTVVCSNHIYSMEELEMFGWHIYMEPKLVPEELLTIDGKSYRITDLRKFLSKFKESELELCLS